MLTKNSLDIDPADPKEAVRLVKRYPGIVTAVLSQHEGRAYANLMAAYCILHRNDRAMPTILLKAATRAPGMAKLLQSFLISDLERHPEVCNKILSTLHTTQVPSEEETDDFKTISALILWPVSV